MTIEAWVKTHSANWSTVLLKERPGSLAYALYSSEGTGKPMAEITAGGGMREARGTSSLLGGVWTHLAATYDGATLRRLREWEADRRAPRDRHAVQSGSALKIGGNAIWGEYLYGLIDEVRVYERALTAAEIQADRDRPVV